MLKQHKTNASTPAVHKANKAQIKDELIRRLSHIQKLAKQKNYTEIQKLLQESYV